MAGLSARTDRSAPAGVNWRALSVLVALTTVGATKPSLPPSRASLCRGQEAPLFSCPIGRKVVSVCRSAGGAAYRFGRPGRVELDIGGGRLAQRGYSGGGETQIVFARGAHRYVVYDRVVRTSFGSGGRHDPQQSSGVLVTRNGKVAANLSCTGSGDYAIHSGQAAGLPKGPFTQR